MGYKEEHIMRFRLNILRTTTLLIASAPAFLLAQKQAETMSKPRVVITADPELDDNNTLIRAILYSSDFDLEGLIYTSSQFHWLGDGKGTTQYIAGREYTRIGLCPCTSWRFTPSEHFIDTILDAYAEVYPNLKIHNPEYPSPSTLKAKVKWGNVSFDGDFSKDTDGSNLIKSLLLDNQPGPLYVTAQGGENTIARALKSIYEQYNGTAQWSAIRAKVSEKLVIIPSGDQDGTGAAYIRPNWPGVREWQFGLDGPNFGYGAQLSSSPQNKVYFSPAWTEKNISSRGPLGSLYRVWGDGKQMVPNDKFDYFGLSGYTAEQLKRLGYFVWLPPLEKGSFLGEGDTPTFLNLIDVGLRDMNAPAWDGWGGNAKVRQGQGGKSEFDQFSGGAAFPVLPPNTSGVARGLAPAGSHANAPQPTGDVSQVSTIGTSLPEPSPRKAALNNSFFAAAQNDFAARLKWSVTPTFGEANHPPVVRINGSPYVTSSRGETVQLRGLVSDPDGDAVNVRWWQDNDAGTYPGTVDISEATSLNSSFRVPDDAKHGQTLQIILEASDSGQPHLTHYRRVIVTVR